VAVCLVAAATVYGYVRWRESQLKQVKLTGLASASGGTAPMNILLVGNNTRTGLDPSEAAQFGSATEVAGARSDVTMILHLDPKTGGASLLSIPRDLFVALPPNSIAGSYGKIDAALNGTNGITAAKDPGNGPNTLITAITNSLGIPINHYISINFDGFQRTIDAIGGISINFPMPVRDAMSGLNIPKIGCQRLNGRNALAVVRARHLQYYVNGRWHDDPLSDLARIRRDHTFLRVFASAARTQMSNPLNLNSLVGGLLNQVTVDSGLNVNAMLGLFRHYRHLDVNTVPQTTLPITVVPNYHYGAGAYGDVDMPVEPLDHQIIDTWSGQPTGPATPSSINVQLVNMSGVSRRAITLATELTSLGFRVGRASTGSVPASVSETVIRYHPGSVGQALGVLHSLSGAVMMQPDSTIADGSVTIDVGSNVTAIQPAPPTTQPAPTTGPAPKATSSSTTSTVPTAGGAPPSSSVDQPQPYDPIAC
jgi:LCP family protein required for cell wall assembly